jgi:hypothetical protein
MGLDSVTAAPRKMVQIETTNSLRQANSLLSDGWDLFTVTPNPEEPKEFGQASRPIKKGPAYDFVLVRYEQ